MITDPETKQPMDSKTTYRILDKAMENGVYFQIQGDHIIKLKPPLVISREEADFALAAIERAFKSVLRV